MRVGESRQMPGVVIEQVFGRPAALMVVWINVALAIAVTVLCIGSLAESAGAPPAYAGVLVALAVLWWVLAATLFVLIARRPRVEPSQVSAVSGAAQQGILITGRATLARTATVAAMACAAFCVVVAVTVGGGWVVFWSVIALGLAMAAVSSGISGARPRELMLAPGGLGAASATSHAEVAWSDVASIEPAPGYGSIIVLRVAVVPGAMTMHRHWRHPFFRARAWFDIEPVSLRLDGTLLLMALHTYAAQPGARAELATGTLPARFVDPTVARATTPTAIADPILRAYSPRV